MEDDPPSPAAEFPSVEAGRLFPAQYHGARLRLLSPVAGPNLSVFVEHLSRVEKHHAPTNGWKFVLHLISLDGAVPRNNVVEDSPQSRNVPLPIAQLVEHSAFRIPRLRRERPVKGTTSRNDPQVSIEHDKRLPDGVNDGLRQAMSMRHGGQRVATGPAERFLSICALGFFGVSSSDKIHCPRTSLLERMASCGSSAQSPVVALRGSQLPPRDRPAMGHKADLRECRTDVAE